MPRIPSPVHNKKPRIEIIPFIDIMFFLLATFMMVSLSMIQNQGIPVNLPLASTASTEDRKNSATITLTREGTLHLDEVPIDRESLVAKLNEMKAANPELRIFINGDRDANFGAAVETLDEIRKAGITRIALQTKPRD